MENLKEFWWIIAIALILIGVIIYSIYIWIRGRLVQWGNVGVVTKDGVPTGEILTPGRYRINSLEEIKQFEVTKIDIGQVGLAFPKDPESSEGVKVLNPGEHYISPLHYIIKGISTRDQLLMVGIKTDNSEAIADEMKADFEDLPLDTVIDDVQVWIPYTLNFRILPDNATEFINRFENISKAVKEVILPKSRKIVRETFRDEIKKQNLSIDEIIDDIRDEIENTMSEKLSQTLIEFGITLNYFNLREPNTGELGISKQKSRINIENAKIQKKENEEKLKTHSAIVALENEKRKENESKALSEENIKNMPKIKELEMQKLLRIEREKDAELKKKLDTMTIQTEIERGEAKAKINKLLASSMNKELIRLEELKISSETSKNWDGKLPLFANENAPFMNLSANLIELINGYQDGFKHSQKQNKIEKSDKGDSD